MSSCLLNQFAGLKDRNFLGRDLDKVLPFGVSSGAGRSLLAVEGAKTNPLDALLLIISQSFTGHRTFGTAPITSGVT